MIYNFISWSGVIIMIIRIDVVSSDGIWSLVGSLQCINVYM